ncbi:MAG: peptidoglycan DD-metalloendopeptidase family protein [Steroidobacteraceae bacterium]|nr:peptidoglycan DD-metalloendopeptidase family protein [Steroidobacteraceae bacterium]
MRRVPSLVWPALLATLLIAACGPRRPEIPAQHVVRAGETLYSISMRYGLDYRDVARWNGIGRDYLIHPGQRLRLDPPPAGARASVPQARVAAPQPRASPDDPRHRPPPWQWPVQGGRVHGSVRQPSGGVGLRIDGLLNQPVLAAADGHVVYTGSGLLGYGQLVIINHVRGWLTAYGHNAVVHVREGEDVRAGQVIGAMGPGPGQQPMLYFEIRLDGQPQDPLAHLPPR